jgi:CheY-like chemotaxis protein
MKRDPNKICVLLVEDDRAIRETMWMVLESEPNFEVHAAEDGKMALDMLAGSKVFPDLIITDLMMPHVTGWELVDALKKMGNLKHIPVIVYSGISHYNVDNKVLQGCYFLRKPVELDVLFDTIKHALSHETDQDIRTQATGSVKKL